MFGMLCIDIYNSVFQFPPISSNFAQPMKWGETTFGSFKGHNQLYVKDYMRQMVVTVMGVRWHSDAICW